MERPLKDDSENYEMLLEEYCDILEETISALRDDLAEKQKFLLEQKKRVDYWCTKATETKALYREQVKETARVRRERTL